MTISEIIIVTNSSSLSLAENSYFLNLIFKKGHAINFIFFALLPKFVSGYAKELTDPITMNLRA